LHDALPIYLIVGGGSCHDTRLDAEAVAQQLHAAPGRDGIVGGKNDTRERGADVRALENGVDAVGAENAVAQLEYDDVRLARGELGQHRARERGAVGFRGGDDAQIGEDGRATRARVFHREDVTPQRHTRGLE